MLKILKQCYRGTKNLPGVGEHPGTIPLIFWIAMVLLTTLDKPLNVILVANFTNLFFILPIYLFGCYDRAVTSDNYMKKEIHDN